MTESFRYRNRILMTGRVVLSLLVLFLVVAPRAWAGCSVQVTSQTDRNRFHSLIDLRLGAPPGRESVSSTSPFHNSSPTGRCTGAWCSGRPAVPAATPEAKNGPTDVGVWRMPLFGPTAAISDVVSPDQRNLNPVQRHRLLFRPPRMHIFNRVSITTHTTTNRSA